MTGPSSRDAWNGARVPADRSAGHYESWFLRANHPTRPLAFWVRYTVFSPRGHAELAVGELWAVVFDGNEIVAHKEEHPFAACSFSRHGLRVRIGDAELLPTQARGHAGEIRWSLAFESEAEPLLLLPESLYSGGFPKAKAMVPTPMARFSGQVELGERTFDVTGWLGSQNHNWGSRHTDRYAWAQVAGFDDAPEVFLECATAKVRLGPVWTPWVTFVVLREGAREWRVSSLWHGARARAHVHDFSWRFHAKRRGLSLLARIEAAPKAFVGLRYANPPGGAKICLNSKIARCEVELRESGTSRRYRTEHRAAFERLLDAAPEGVPVVT